MPTVCVQPVAWSSWAYYRPAMAHLQTSYVPQSVPRLARATEHRSMQSYARGTGSPTVWNRLLSARDEIQLSSDPLTFERSLVTWSTTIKNSRPTAMSTLNLAITIPHPPNCPKRFVSTNTVARNFPHPQLMSMYSRCSFHWKYIRKPSSKNVAIRQSRATVGKTFLPRLIT